MYRCIKVRMLLQFPESRVANHPRIDEELLSAYVTAFELLPLMFVQNPEIVHINIYVSSIEWVSRRTVRWWQQVLDSR